MVEQAWVALGVVAGVISGLAVMPIFGLLEGYTSAQILEQTFRPDWIVQSMAAHFTFAILYGVMGGFFAHNWRIHRNEQE